MNWLLKIIASNGLKLGVAYALEIASGAALTVQAILNSVQISDVARARLKAVEYGLSAVSEFLRRVSAIIGTPDLPLRQAASIDGINDAADKLYRIVDGL